jgi:hypothetical protein
MDASPDAAEFSSAPAPPPPHFVWSPSPAIAGADETSDLVPAMRSAPESSSRDENFFALRIDLRQSIPAVVTGILTICASSHEM